MKTFTAERFFLENEFLALPITNQNVELTLSEKRIEKIFDLISKIWEFHDSKEIYNAIIFLLKEGYKRRPIRLYEREIESNNSEYFSEKDIYIICFGDHIKERNGQASGNRSNLQILHGLIKEHFPPKKYPNLTIHLLPHYPSPGIDRGFDVITPFKVQRTMGNWDDIREIRNNYNLMFDFVLNHLSIQNPWYQEMLKGNPEFKDFFITFHENDPKQMEELSIIREKHLKKIVRPRAHDPFVKVKMADGTYTHTFMHFSHAQPDVNYKNPTVFLKMAEALIFYVIQGACTLRLDAVGYIWKEWGTPCIHHPKTHLIVELFRQVSDAFSPTTILLVEAMEPPQDAKRYLTNERIAKAHMSYNFTPCGLIPHTLISHDSSRFQGSLSTFDCEIQNTTQAVVCGITHDGSSLNACRKPKTVVGSEILTEYEIEKLADYFHEVGIQEIEKRGKLHKDSRYYVSPSFRDDFKLKHGEDIRFKNFKLATDGKGNQRNIVYECVSTYSSLFKSKEDKIISALAMALPLKGIPFVYLPALFGAFNDYYYYLETGGPRQLNEGRLILEEIKIDLADKDSLTTKIFSRILKLINIRTNEKAFHPQGQMIGIETNNKSIFAFLRVSPDKQEKILVIQNVSDSSQNFKFFLNKQYYNSVTKLVDLINGKKIKLIEDVQLALTLNPFQIMWLKCYKD